MTKVTTEFLRVSQRKAYDSCMAHHNKDIPFVVTGSSKAFEAGFLGFTNNYDVRGDLYAYFCAGRDKRAMMKQAA